ncbi:serine/threonine protein kinase [Allomyces macrogynus ATCC 38327]|uniref:Serine/threonine protein kinase n=1 Tax=Allomyces macrogynus (strain ATCC 38327) TaxID=578462 RepID=A0A0L0TF89_ALLM3|nr:serine/threonine protein kinase [Allomyces macrogynus ATCC 38327]|eukprot:KNE73370.1 serine/threonine protein kinase [Allomyces macrogynus ATCC 38327]
MPPTTKLSPRDTAAVLEGYFKELLTYAKHVLEHRPGEVVAMTSLSSSSWRKEHWQKIIQDGRARGIAHLPNASSIDQWFEQFRCYKRMLKSKNVPVANYRRASTPLPDFDEGFESALRAHQKALAESDDDDEDRSTDDDVGISEEDTNESDKEAASRTVEPTWVVSAQPVPSGPMTRSRTRRTVVPPSQYPNTAAPPRAAEAVVDTLNSSMNSMRVRSDPNKHAQPLPQHRVSPPPPLQHSLQQHVPRAAQAHGAQLYQQQMVQARQQQQQQQQQRVSAMSTDVQLLRLLAAGGQATVFLARLPLDSRSLVVVKVFYCKPSPHELDGMRAMSMTTFTIRLIGESHISRDSLIPFTDHLRQHDVDINAFKFDENGCVTGWCYERLQGDLESAILDRKRPMNNTMKLLVGLQIAYFLHGVHTAGFIFRDLKPSNVLVNKDLHGADVSRTIQYFLEHEPVIKVTDFGLVTHERASKKTRAAGTVGYMPAAQMNSDSYDKTVDLTAYGITLAEILTNDLMYDVSEADSEVEEEFRSLRVIERVNSRFARHKGYIPSALRSLILDAVAGRIDSIQQFIEFLEGMLKAIAFGHDAAKSSLNLMSDDAGTPARATAPAPGPLSQGARPRHAQAARGGMTMGCVGTMY